MIMRIWALVVIGCAAFKLVAADASNPETRVPVLLELFTSEGCSSCPPADKLLAEFDRTQPVTGAIVIVLSEHVDYWNQLGWKDPFSSAAYSQRQQDYSLRFKLDSAYTPQLVVDGRIEMNGSDRARAVAEIRRAIQESKVPISLTQLARDEKEIRLHIEVQAALNHLVGNAIVYIAVADNEDLSNVSRGENSGRSLRHVAVARSLTSIGKTGKDGKFSRDLALPFTSDSSSGIRVIAFVQDRVSRRVLGVAQHRL